VDEFGRLPGERRDNPRIAVAERIGTIILSALVAHTGWHWMIERGERLLQFRIQWPALTAVLLAGVMRWLMVLVIIAGVVWLCATVAAGYGRFPDAESHSRRMFSLFRRTASYRKPPQ